MIRRPKDLHDPPKATPAAGICIACLLGRGSTSIQTLQPTTSLSTKCSNGQGCLTAPPLRALGIEEA